MKFDRPSTYTNEIEELVKKAKIDADKKDPVMGKALDAMMPPGDHRDLSEEVIRAGMWLKIQLQKEGRGLAVPLVTGASLHLLSLVGGCAHNPWPIAMAIVNELSLPPLELK